MQNNKKIISILVLIIVVGCCVWYIKNQYTKRIINTPVSVVNPYLNSKIELTIFKNSDNTYGYSIFIDNRQYIHQPNIPSITGITGFKTESDTRKIAELVIAKIRDNKVPPSITMGELIKLGIQY